jgi:hypothetical protein
MEWLKVKELRGELRSAHMENARLRQQVEMATVLEKIAPASEVPALLADSAALMREMMGEIDSQRLHIESLQNRLAQASAEVVRLREDVLAWKGRALALMPYVPDETLIRTIQADAIRAAALLKEQSE